MKIEQGTLVKHLPPKLRDLVLKEANRKGKDEEEVLEGDIDAAFIWDGTSQGHDFWSDIYYGREIPDEFLEETYEIY